jgi:bifunctional enzyme CysN/CysC
VYVNTPIDVCEQRDPKGLYAKARSGNLADFTGIGASYEPPVNPDLEVTPESGEIFDQADLVVDLLMDRLSLT